VPVVVLSDLDGVLVDSHAAIERAWRGWADRHGVQVAAIERIQSGRPSLEIIAAVAPGLDAAAESEALDALQTEDTDGVVSLAGAHELFERIAPDRLAVVTSCTAPLAVARLEAAGLPLPEVLVTSDRLRRGKPDPEGYLLAARELGVDPRSAVVLEDAPAGVAAGRAAGAHVVGILTSHRREQLPEAHEHFADIAEWLSAPEARRNS
jgi:mannitol-1-/sugar-/sorbitol-6-phosphatase